nr:protein umuc [Pantoea agglomerans]
MLIVTLRHDNEPQYSNTACRICDYPTNDTRDIIASALGGLTRIWREGYRYAKAGVMPCDFDKPGEAYYDMFSNSDNPSARLCVLYHVL